MNIYNDLVRETLMHAWGDKDSTMRISAPDLTAGIELFVKIAVESVEKAQYSASKETHSTTADKIKKFVREKHRWFQKSCIYGFPYSRLTGADTESALRTSLEKHGDMLAHSLMLNDWVNEKDLEERFGTVVSHLKSYELENTCQVLREAYKHDNFKAGYALLWLIKFTGACDFKIPDKIENTTVSLVLSDFVRGSLKVAKPTNFVTLFLSMLDLMKPDALMIFYNFVGRTLATIPLDSWQDKPFIITRLGAKVIQDIAPDMASSNDAPTAEIGRTLLAAFAARTFRRALPHFYALQKLLPGFDEEIACEWFDKPFVEFRKSKLSRNDESEFTRQVQFYNRSNVFVRGSHMIGIQYPKYLPPHLLAYDMTTEKMVWGIPIQTSKEAAAFQTYQNFYVEMVDDTIFLQVNGQTSVSLIDPEAGEVKSTLELPVETKHVHFGPQGLAYLYANDQLYGGEIKDSKWTTTFAVPVSSNDFHPLSTHCGIYDRGHQELILFGPTGVRFKIDNCMSFQAVGDKLYTIERSTGNTCTLNVRTLRLDNAVVSPGEMSIAITVPESKIRNVSQNGIVVLFAMKMYKISPIFVDLKTQQVTYNDQEFFFRSPWAVNNRTGDLWIRDDYSKMLWKISAAQSLNMGNFGGRNWALLHVDDADHLYFT